LPRIAVLLPVAVTLLALACGAPRPEPEQDLTARPESEEETAQAVAAQADTAGAEEPPVIVLPERDPYRMTVGDEISVWFFYYPAYNVGVVVRPDGYVTIPLVGEVKAEGMTPSELEAIVRDRYSRELAEPEVSVIVTEFADQRVFVFGEVYEPGAYAIRGSATVLDAVAEAGGMTYNGRTDSVILIRQQPDGTFAGTRVNLQDLLAGRPAEDTMLKPGDVVYVPMTFIAKVDVFVDQFFAKLTPTWYFFIAGREVLNPEGRYIIGR
jgi:polysaccharide export outer membrane protein